MTQSQRLTSVIVVEPHPMLRNGLIQTLDVADQLHVVGEAADNTTAVQLSRKQQPDVLIVGVASSTPACEDGYQELFRAFPAARVVVLADDEPWTLRRFMVIGADAYLARHCNKHELIAAVHSVTHDPNRVLLSLSRKSLKWLDGRGNDLLSRRELEILELAAKGMSNIQIARLLHISNGTVKRHFSNIYTKLHVCSRLDAVRAALRSGLITQEALTAR